MTADTLPDMDPAGVPEELPSLTDAQARGAEDVGRLAADRERDRMPAWIPRLLLLVVLTVFAAYAAFSLIRRLRDLVLWIVAALFLS
ncbi:MAG: hypothetical protein WD248_05665, partial [Actinomycetota bacterium]